MSKKKKYIYIVNVCRAGHFNFHRKTLHEKKNIQKEKKIQKIIPPERKKKQKKAKKKITIILNQ